MVGLLGKKLGQTRVYTKDGRAVSVTVVQAGPNHVLQCKTTEKDGYEAVQLGFDEQKEQRLSLAKANSVVRQSGAAGAVSRKSSPIVLSLSPRASAVYEPVSCIASHVLKGAA